MTNNNDTTTQTTPFNLDFGALDNLENFDFDSFLNNDPDTTGFGFDPNMATYPEGVETGTGDGL